MLEVGAATVTKENRVVRTFKVADPTACINVSVWDEPSNLLVPGDIVRLTKGYAAVWRQCLTLYSGKNGDIQKVGDFCLNFNEQLNMSEPNLTLVPTPVNPLINQKNQPASSNVLTNNGTLSNNGNSSTSSDIRSANVQQTILSTTSTNNNNNNSNSRKSNGNNTSAIISNPSKLIGTQLRNSATDHGKILTATATTATTTTNTMKANLRAGRSNQTRSSNLKSDRR